MMFRWPRMAPHVARHLGALARLGARDAQVAAQRYGASAARLALAGVAGFLAVLMGCAWILAAVWDTEYRTLAAGLLTAAFAIPAFVFAVQGARALALVEPFAATRRNLEADRRLYAEIRPEEASQPTAEPESQLEASRSEIRRLAARDRPPHGHDVTGGNSAQASSVRARAGTRPGFPRSRTMQLLTNGQGGTAALLAHLLQRGAPRRGRPGAARPPAAEPEGMH